MARPTRRALSGLVSGGACVFFLLMAGPAFAADVSLGSVELRLGIQPFASAQQVITTDVRVFSAKIAMPAALEPFVFTVMMQGMTGALPGACDGVGAGLWSCDGDLEPTGKITISYRTTGTIVPPGAYRVTVTMLNNGVGYTGTATVTVIAPPATTPPATIPAAGSPPGRGGTGPPAGRSPVPVAETGAGVSVSASATVATTPSRPPLADAPTRSAVPVANPPAASEATGGRTRLAILAAVLAVVIASGALLGRRLVRRRSAGGAPR